LPGFSDLRNVCLKWAKDACEAHMRALLRQSNRFRGSFLTEAMAVTFRHGQVAVDPGRADKPTRSSVQDDAGRNIVLFRCLFEQQKNRWPL